MTTFDDLEDADFDDAEQQLRFYGFGWIERKDDEWWCELVYVLARYHDEHLHYPTEDEFRRLWRQDCDEQIRAMKKVLGQGTH